MASANASKEQQRIEAEKDKRKYYMNSVLIATQVSKLLSKNGKILTYDELFDNETEDTNTLSLLMERRNRKLKENKEKKGD